MRILLVTVLFSGHCAAQLFTLNCAGCHGLDGRGGEHAPNIATDANVQKLSDADLARIVRNGIPAAGMPAFGTMLNDHEIASVLRELRTLQGSRNRSIGSGYAARGRELFFGNGRCAECHMVNGQGGFLGADLSGYGKTHSATDIRAAVLEPKKNPDERHGMIIVVTRSGQHLTGVLRNEDNFSLQMQTVNGNFHSFDKSALVEIKHLAHPVAHLNDSEIQSLVSFLAASPRVLSTDASDEDDQ